MGVTMTANNAILSRDEYREFNDKVAILQGRGYDLPFEVEFIKEDDTFKVTIHGKHDVDELDRMTS
tara:strand:- start:1784 stop:1981 length:198 start_codon:yes stop_codon:yes gene_type:complete